VAEIAEMADHEVVEPDGEDGVPSAGRTALVVVERADTGNEHLAHFVFTRAAQDDRLPTDALETGMTGVVVRDGHHLRFGLRDGVSRFGIRRIREHDPLAPARAEAGVSQPGQVHGMGREYAKHRSGPGGIPI
jgi:hypothetical protein